MLKTAGPLAFGITTALLLMLLLLLLLGPVWRCSLEVDLPNTPTATPDLESS